MAVMGELLEGVETVAAAGASGGGSGGEAPGQHPLFATHVVPVLRQLSESDAKGARLLERVEGLLTICGRQLQAADAAGAGANGNGRCGAALSPSTTAATTMATPSSYKALGDELSVAADLDSAPLGVAGEVSLAERKGR